MRRSLASLPASLALLLAAPLAGRCDVRWNGLYHNNTNRNARTEAVPAELAPGQTNRFLEVDYASSRVNVYFLTDHPAADGAVSCRVRFYSTVEEFEPAQWQSNVVLTAAAPFHGTPAAGSYTVEVWKASWQPPNGFVGTVWYAPQVLENGGAGDIQSLVRDTAGFGGSEWGSNNAFWVQDAQAIGGQYPNGRDYPFEWTNKMPRTFDGFYLNSVLQGLPQDEAVPGLGGTNFLRYSYDPAKPSYVHLLAPKGGLTSARTRFWLSGGVGEMIRDAQWCANVALPSATPFHGHPVSGTATMDVWRTAFYPPANWGAGGETVYYATEITVPKNGTIWMTPGFVGQTDGEALTNDWPVNPQLFSSYGPADLAGHDWSYTPTAGIARAQSLTRDWAYHNNETAYNPQLELVPGKGVLHFLDVSYAATATTFHVLMDHPTAALVPGETVLAKLRVWWSSEKGDEWLPMNWVDNVTLSAADPFHGLPVAGTKTLGLWKATWAHPTNGLGPVTNQLDVYYAPWICTRAGLTGSYETDYAYLTRSSGSGAAWGSNNYAQAPQIYGPDAAGHDYKYVHKWRDEGDDDGDGMPNWFEELYFGGKTNGSPTGHADADTLNNLGEYIADTDPSITASTFLNQVTNISVSGNVVQLPAGPRTSTLRVYDVWRATNLLEASPWTPLGLNVPGRYDGGVVMLTFTNQAGQGYFRTGVKLP